MGFISFSWKIATKTIARWTMPFVALPIAIWNSSTGSVSATVEGIADPRDFWALPNNDEVWFTVEYLGSSSTPQGSYTAGTKANNLATGSAPSASTQAWDSAATAWATSTAYTVGTIRKVSTNAGRLSCDFYFWHGRSGTDNTIFSSAVDGGTVTDNSGANQVVWKAMWRFNRLVTLSPNPGMAGPLTIYTNVGKASLNGVYIDPLITLS